MSTAERDSPGLTALPLWQVMLVLVGVPTVYVANSLSPWSIALLTGHDHGYFLQFWSLIAVMHWSRLALIVVLLKRGTGDWRVSVSIFRRRVLQQSSAFRWSLVSR